MAVKKYETILVEKQNGITWVTFNRPDKRNAMSPQMHLDMDDVLDELASDEETPANRSPRARTSVSISAAPKPIP